MTKVTGYMCALALALGVSGLSADDKPGDGPHYRARQILGSKVSIDSDREVGVVEDIVLDDNGNVDYLVVGTSQNKLVTVPWDAARFNAEKRMAVVHIAPEQFQQVPTYTPESYPVYSAPAYRTQIYKYYGLTPGQQRRLIRRGVAP